MKLFKGILLTGIIIVAMSVPVFADDDSNNYSEDNYNAYQHPYKTDAYGPGVNSDATGRPFQWRTQSGQSVTPGTPVKPDAYGYGTGMDAYGRPVRATGK